MNALPSHRQIINGRTHASAWSAASADPIRRYRRAIDWKSPLLASVIGVVAAAALFIGLSS